MVSTLDSPLRAMGVRARLAAARAVDGVVDRWASYVVLAVGVAVGGLATLLWWAA